MMMMIPAKNSPTPAAHQDPRELCKDSGYLYEAVMSKPRQGQCRKLSWKCRDVGTFNSLSYYMNTCTPPHACTFVCARACACAHTHIPDTESFLYARQRSASTLPLHALSNLKAHVVLFTGTIVDVMRKTQEYFSQHKVFPVQIRFYTYVI